MSAAEGGSSPLPASAASLLVDQLFGGLIR
ncbi:hypothetical protein BH24ACT1_BH24ACT1_11160 [soil metagenome]